MLNLCRDSGVQLVNTASASIKLIQFRSYTNLFFHHWCLTFALTVTCKGDKLGWEMVINTLMLGNSILFNGDRPNCRIAIVDVFLILIFNIF